MCEVSQRLLLPEAFPPRNRSCDLRPCEKTVRTTSSSGNAYERSYLLRLEGFCLVRLGCTAKSSGSTACHSCQCACASSIAHPSPSPRVHLARKQPREA